MFIRGTKCIFVYVFPLTSFVLFFVYRVNEEQYSYLCGIKMKHVFTIAEILSGWIGHGIYDFQHLPFSMKTELGLTVVDEIQLRIQVSGKGDFIHVHSLL